MLKVVLAFDLTTVWKKTSKLEVLPLCLEIGMDPSATSLIKYKGSERKSPSKAAAIKPDTASETPANETIGVVCAVEAEAGSPTPEGAKGAGVEVGTNLIHRNLEC